MVSPSNPPLRPPKGVLDLAERLENAGFETWCVGGAVRDALMGHDHLDWDLATAAKPEEVQRLFRRTVPVGIDFGTVGVFDRGGTMHEVTTFRRDVETDGRHAVVAFGASIEEDLARRDFTLNAIAFHPRTGELRDPFGGRKDIAARLVRAVGEPSERMREDRLRALRGIRFGARFGFEIEPSTWKAIVESAPHLGRLSAERVKQELEKTMDQVPAAGAAIASWGASGALGVLLPALGTISDLVLGTLDRLPRAAGRKADQRRIVRLAALFSDLPPRQVEKVARGLRFSTAQGDWMRALVTTMQAIMPGLRVPQPEISEVTLRRWIAEAGRTRVASALRLASARLAAERTSGAAVASPAAMASIYRRAVRAAFRDPIELSDLAVDGDDLKSAGITDGREIGRTLRALLDHVLEDPSLNQRDRLLALARDLHRQRAGDPSAE